MGKWTSPPVKFKNPGEDDFSPFPNGYFYIIDKDREAQARDRGAGWKEANPFPMGKQYKKRWCWEFYVGPDNRITAKKDVLPGTGYIWEGSSYVAFFNSDFSRIDKSSWADKIVSECYNVKFDTSRGRNVQIWKDEEEQEERREDDTEWEKHTMKDEEILQGFTPDSNKKYELTFPDIVIQVPNAPIPYPNTGESSDNPSDRGKMKLNKDFKMKLTAGDDSGTGRGTLKYKKEITADDVKESVKEGDSVVNFVFPMTPDTGVKYTLEIDQGKDDEGNQLEKHEVFKDKKYEEIKRLGFAKT
jgi:hypothetical protein